MTTMRLYHLFTILIFHINFINSLIIPTSFNHFQSLFSYQTSVSSFDDWLSFEKQICINSILGNIGGEYSINKDLLPGVIIASPSTSFPNYYYQWTRDSAITLNLIVDQVYKNPKNTSLINIIEAYIENTMKLQKIPNRSGGVDDYSNLGEPKFEVNLSNFDQNWGRPQRDGPGLRSISIMKYLDFLSDHGLPVTNTNTLHNASYIYHEVIKPDLMYNVKYWNSKGFDLWEEIEDYHFFTSLIQLKSLSNGLEIAKQFNDSLTFQSLLNDSISNLEKFINNDAGFINPYKPYIVSAPTIYQNNKRNGLDIATILASLYTHELTNSSVIIPFDIDNGYVLTTLSSLIADMKIRYPINLQDNLLGVALGRYPEDVYDGYQQTEGNPWFISTATASEFIYRLIHKLRINQQDIVINNSNIDFFKPFINIETENSNENGGLEDELFRWVLEGYSETYRSGWKY
ncbi:hypothetical protein G210_5274 [Candida maltosa Xu316]|uniref:glucan 1,4-alpha-glucosidase n=1 Tax=Candida maltosa (strain Xu316) TaxID=1245528 RepID=M3HQU8_CANMX|nr:hypothetical protein G210_5274 [Candida maltosa Xu316]